MIDSFKKHFFSIFLFSLVFSQPDSRFNTFDWVLYQQTGRIVSISDGFSFAYLATENAGILRYNLYHNTFEDPITTAQGLSDNQTNAVHFDKSTNILWVATNNHLNYSYNAEGNWFSKQLSEIGLTVDNVVSAIGSSNSFVWLFAGSSYIKIDKVSGLLLGIYPSPDEENINWSSSHDLFIDIPQNFLNYSIMDGWMITPSDFINPYGKRVNISTFKYGEFGKVLIGLDDGTILIGDVNAQFLYAYKYGLNQLNVNEFTKGDIMWLVGHYNRYVNGLTQYNINNGEFYYIDFEDEINLNSRSFYSLLETKDETWIGSNSLIAIYDKEDDYWREIGEEKGLPSSIINCLEEDESSIWIGTNSGLVEISKTKKYPIESELGKILRIEKINDLEIIDNELWIATKRQLLIYDKSSNKLIDFQDFGKIDKIGKRVKIFNDFSDIFSKDNQIYITTTKGILKYNIENEFWDIAVEPSAYGGSYINKIAVNDEYCFAGTQNGIWQINMNDGNSQLFDFKFIGPVNDLYLWNEKLFIGSDNGFIKYLWKNIL